MRNYLPTMLFAGLLGVASLSAGPVTFTLNPANGILNTSAGSLTGWGFTLNNASTNWISVTSSALTFESGPALGAYTDFIGLQGGPSPFFAVAPSTIWTEAFDGVSQGAGSYAVSPTAVLFAQNNGFLLVNYDIFDGDPLAGGNQIGSESRSSAFTVNIADSPSSVPEPSTFALVGGILAMAVAFGSLVRPSQNPRARRKE